MLITAIVLILIGVGLAAFLLVWVQETSFSFIHEFSSLLGRLAFAILGTGLLLLGLTLFQNYWTGTGLLIGTFLFIIGIQISLWSVGVSLDFLANKPLEENFRIRTEMSHEPYENEMRGEDIIRGEAYYLIRHLSKYEIEILIRMLKRFED